MRRIPRYPALALVLALVVLTGCGSPSGGATAPAAPATASAGAVVEHKFGSTEVPANVERVATVGWNDQDFVLSLGVVPVVTRAWYDD